MLYAVLKTIHLLSLIAWVGGMFFTLACLRPALATLDGPARLALMEAALGRFFTIVNVAIALVLVSGLAMLALHGWSWRLPHAWYLMIVLGLVMMGIFGHIRGRLYRRLQAAVKAQDGPAGAAALASIRREVLVNLVLGVIVIVAMKLA